MAASTSSHVAIIGSGNWGSAVARRVGLNLQDRTTDVRETSVKMWVFEEVVDGRKLSEIINTDHENPKYLPGVRLPPNVVACTDLLKTIDNAHILLFVVPHQFLPGVLKALKGHVAPTTICVSLIKGVEVSEKGLTRFSEFIQDTLGVENVAVVMGANVAADVAADHFAETTVACKCKPIARKVATLFDCDTFQADITDDIATVELLGALKNIYALGAGLCDGLGYGSSSKAALIRKGLEEMATFCALFGEPARYRHDTLLGSCGVADLVATCYGGRNRRCAAEFARRRAHASLPFPPEEAEALWAQIEAELLGGQKLQGVSTCREVAAFLEAERARCPEGAFPLLRRIHAIAVEGEPVETLLPRANSVDHRSHIHGI